MKKKLILCLLVCVLSLNLISCGNEKATPQENSSTKTQETQRTDENESKEKSTKNSVNTDSNKGVKSSISSPLNLGEIGISSKLTLDGSTKEVSVSLDKITRGAAAQNVVDKYNSEDNAVILSPLESDTMEYVVADYSLIIPEEFPHDEYSPNGEISAEICGTDGEGLTYKGVLYCISTWNLDTTFDVAKPNIPYKSSFVFQIPKGCTDYIIKLGEYDGAQAFYRGK